MLLIYTHKITNRVEFSFKHLIQHILGIPLKFTTAIDDFVAYNGPKITYTKKPLGSEFFIQSHSLLFEQGVEMIDIEVEDWNGTSAFFKTSSVSTVPYDIFAASFYLLSRYEEYLPYIKNSHNCFPETESIAFKNGFLNQPIIDIWAYLLLDLLKKKFPTYEYPQKEFKIKSTITVSQPYLFKNKSILRTLLEVFLEITKFDFSKIMSRMSTIFNLAKDPHDTFNTILALHKKLGLKANFYFLIGNFTTYDNAVAYSNENYQSLIKHISDYTDVGLLASYFTMDDEDKLKKEIQLFEQIINVPLTTTRQHFNRLKIPETYQQLLEYNIKSDCSMAYRSNTGFRSGTCTPFYFYDLNYEIQTPLKIYTYAFTDKMLKEILKLSDKKSLEKIKQLKEEVKKVNGTFIVHFHNEAFSKKGIWKNWTAIYKTILTQ